MKSMKHSLISGAGSIWIVVYGVCSVLDQVGAAQILKRASLKLSQEFHHKEQEKGVEGYQSIFSLVFGK